eukprot:scaffold104328_cov35-Prasinocladus_malaysianus.AAC.1
MIGSIDIGTNLDVHAETATANIPIAAGKIKGKDTNHEITHPFSPNHASGAPGGHVDSMAQDA